GDDGSRHVACHARVPPLQLVDQALRKAGRRPGSLGPRGQPGHAADYTSRSRLGHKVDWSVSDVLDIRPLLDGPDDPRLAAGSSSVCPDCPLVAAVPPATPAP